MYVCGPTVYQRAHIGNARAVRDLLVAAQLAARARLRRHVVHNITDVNDKIYEAAPGASAEPARATRPRGTSRTRPSFGLGMPDEQPLATETIPEIVALIEELVAAGHAYEAGGDVYFRVSSFDELRRALRAPARPDRGAGAEPAEGGPARLRALEGDEGGRGHLLGLALGPRPARLAHRVLRDGREDARARVRDPRRRPRPRLPPPRERARAVAGASDGRSRRSGCTTGCSSSPARRCRSRSATSRRSRR